MNGELYVLSIKKNQWSSFRSFDDVQVAVKAKSPKEALEKMFKLLNEK